MSKTRLPNDFERMIPEYHKETVTYAEHMVRYEAVRELVKDKVVLDIASGSGYGTALMAQQAKKVYGVDVAENAVEYARENYGAKNIEYKVGDGVKIPLDNHSVEVVVSFETIEHIEDYKTFMKEIRRILKPEGLLLLSTPNDLEFAEGNHFHIHEFTYKELKSLIKDYFKFTKDYFQVDWVYSGIHNEHEVIEAWNKEIKVSNLAPLKLDQSVYFFIICSNREITENVDSFGSLAAHWSERSNQNKRNLTEDHIRNITDISEDRLTYARNLEQILKTKEELINKQEAEIAEFNKIKQSKLYKIYKKLR